MLKIRCPNKCTVNAQLHLLFYFSYLLNLRKKGSSYTTASMDESGGGGGCVVGGGGVQFCVCMSVRLSFHGNSTWLHVNWMILNGMPLLMACVYRTVDVCTLHSACGFISNKAHLYADKSSSCIYMICLFWYTCNYFLQPWMASV